MRARGGVCGPLLWTLAVRIQAGPLEWGGDTYVPPMSMIAHEISLVDSPQFMATYQVDYTPPVLVSNSFEQTSSYRQLAGLVADQECEKGAHRGLEEKQTLVNYADRRDVLCIPSVCFRRFFETSSKE